MGINTEISVKANFHRKWISVRRLQEILSRLDEGTILTPNGIGNLVAVSGSGDMIGYIDIGAEIFEKSVR